jgi:hypothetical protein
VSDATSLRNDLEKLEPGLRILAGDVLGLDRRLEYVAADRQGRLVVCLQAAPGRELEAVADALAQIEFLIPRVADWKKLSPDLPLDPSAPARALLVAADFPLRARAASRSAGAGRVELVLRRSGHQVRRLSRPKRKTAPTPPPRSSFRTGLRDEDLGLTPEERVEFSS